MWNVYTVCRACWHWNYLLLYWKFPMMHIQLSAAIWLTVQHSVKSTASWLVGIGKIWEGNFEHWNALLFVVVVSLSGSLNRMRSRSLSATASGKTTLTSNSITTTPHKPRTGNRASLRKSGVQGRVEPAAASTKTSTKYTGLTPSLLGATTRWGDIDATHRLVAHTCEMWGEMRISRGWWLGWCPCMKIMNVSHWDFSG